MKIYIVRHGQTDSNLRHACVGRSDVPLNKTGEEQARRLAERTKNFEVSAVYTSPLVRAVNTAMPIIGIRKNVKLIMNYGLTERDFGLWEDMNYREIEEKYPAMFKKWQSSGYLDAPPEGESVEDMQKRAGDALDKIIAAHEGENLLLVSHMAVTRTILAHLLGLEPCQSMCFRLDNTGIAVVEYSDGKGVLTGFNI